jgi:hypothetical protein
LRAREVLLPIKLRSVPIYVIHCRVKGRCDCWRHRLVENTISEGLQVCGSLLMRRGSEIAGAELVCGRVTTELPSTSRPTCVTSSSTQVGTHTSCRNTSEPPRPMPSPPPPPPPLTDLPSRALRPLASPATRSATASADGDSACSHTPPTPSCLRDPFEVTNPTRHAPICSAAVTLVFSRSRNRGCAPADSRSAEATAFLGTQLSTLIMQSMGI